jgi:hypothetical protein
MSLFLVHNEDGKIIQANKLYDTPTAEYIDQMKNIGSPYIAVDRESLVRPDSWWVNNQQLCEMETMIIAVSKTAIKAGGADTVVLTGAPAGCEYRIEANVPGVGTVIPYAGTLPDGELEVGMDVPCFFTIYFSKWPLKEFSVVIEARA